MGAQATVVVGGTVDKGMVGFEAGADWVEASALTNVWRDEAQSNKVAESFSGVVQLSDGSKSVREGEELIKTRCARSDKWGRIKDDVVGDA